MNMIKLGNTGAHRGQNIWINADHITAVFSTPSEDGGSLQTQVYGGYSAQGINWTVEESVEEVLKKMKASK